MLGDALGAGNVAGQLEHRVVAADDRIDPGALTPIAARNVGSAKAVERAPAVAP
jgi:hypothetical protein